MTLIQQKDTTFTKIFVGGLPYHTTDRTLREFFQQFGEIEEAVVITDRQTGKSRGYGFVTMSERRSTEQACLEPNPIIDGRKANVNLAYLGAKPRIAAADLLAALPLGLKSPGLTLSLFAAGQHPSTAAASYPGQQQQLQQQHTQYIYPSYFGLPASATAVNISSPFTPCHGVNAGPFIDYSPGTAAALSTGYTTIQVPATAGTPGGSIYDIATVNAFTQNVNGAYVPQGAFFPSTATFAALPQQAAIASHYAPHYQQTQ